MGHQAAIPHHGQKMGRNRLAVQDFAALEPKCMTVSDDDGSFIHIARFLSKRKS